MAAPREDWMEVLGFHASDEVEKWVHDFLQGPGKNKPFSDGLKLIPRYWQLPMKLPLNLMNRNCGPEPGIEFYQAGEDWEQKITEMVTALNNGWNPPPLIVSYDGKFVVNDGNHRHEALLRTGIENYWTLIWSSSKKDNADFMNLYT